MKPFYEFSSNIFRNELLMEYIIPVAKWFMVDDKPSGYLLPQASGSFWECSLAIDFLLRVSTVEGQHDLNRLIEPKVVNTTRWIVDSLYEEGSDEMSWDSAPWDTAVALRSVINCLNQYPNSFTNDEKNKINMSTMKIVRWLIKQGVNWKSAEGYLTADSTDLAVTLSVLIRVKEMYNDNYFTRENIEIDTAIKTIVLMLLQCANMEIDKDNSSIKPENWGSVFNIGEVICGLSSYVLFREADDSLKRATQESILEGLKYIENAQGNGGITDNSVADSCGILWSYFVTSKACPEYGHDDIMVFKSLCWMCDSNKVLADGSFLHTSYATVFYALSLIEAYETWELGHKPTNEVYHMVVWLNPNIETTERARRLDLELKQKKNSEELSQLKYLVVNRSAIFSTILIVTLLIIVTLIILQACKAVNISIEFLDFSLLFSILSVSVIIISGIGKITYEFLKKKYSR